MTITPAPVGEHTEVVDVSADGKRMVFMRGNVITALKSVHVSTRPDVNAAWPTPVQIIDFGGSSGCCPTHTPDANELIVEIDGQLGRMVYVDPNWSAPEVFQSGAGDPYLTRDGRTLVLTRMVASYDLAYMDRTCLDPLGP